MRALRWSWLVVWLFGCGAPAVPETPKATLDAIDRDITASCGGPEAVTACAPLAFCKTASSWPSGGCDALDKNRRALADRWLKELDDNDWPVAYGLAHLEIESALPVLRAKLVGSTDRYGWDAPFPGHEGDGQYPRAMALVIAIESLSKRRAAAYVALTADEQDRLDTEAAGTDDRAAAARWLIKTLHR
jgi:hypothetical protein